MNEASRTSKTYGRTSYKGSSCIGVCFDDSEELKYAVGLGYKVVPISGYLFERKESPFKDFVSSLFSSRFGINPKSTIIEVCNFKRYTDVVSFEGFIHGDMLSENKFIGVLALGVALMMDRLVLLWPFCGFSSSVRTLDPDLKEARIHATRERIEDLEGRQQALWAKQEDLIVRAVTRREKRSLPPAFKKDEYEVREAAGTMDHLTPNRVAFIDLVGVACRPHFWKGSASKPYVELPPHTALLGMERYTKKRKELIAPLGTSHLRIGLGPCLPNNLSTYGLRQFHISRSEWDRVFSRLTIVPGFLDFRLMNKKENGILGFSDSSPATCPLDPSPAHHQWNLCGTSGTQKSWVIIGPMLRAKPIPKRTIQTEAIFPDLLRLTALLPIVIAIVARVWPSPLRPCRLDDIPTFLYVDRNPESCLRFWRSFSIPLLFGDFHFLPDSPPTCLLRPVIPKNTYPLSYRGCWHGVSRAFFLKSCHDRVLDERDLQAALHFFTHAILLDRAFAYCPGVPTAALHGSLGRVLVSVWVIIRKDQLSIIGLIPENNVRLACVKHIASVPFEPGSNSSFDCDLALQCLVIDILEKLVKSRQTLSKAIVARNGFSQAKRWEFSFKAARMTHPKYMLSLIRKNMHMIAEMKDVDKKLKMREPSPEREGDEGNYGRMANPTPTQ
nr:hypothetical protein [Tanacetum cinerariifolium]